MDVEMNQEASVSPDLEVIANHLPQQAINQPPTKKRKLSSSTTIISSNPTQCKPKSSMDDERNLSSVEDEKEIPTEPSSTSTPKKGTNSPSKKSKKSSSRTQKKHKSKKKKGTPKKEGKGNKSKKSKNKKSKSKSHSNNNCFSVYSIKKVLKSDPKLKEFKISADAAYLIGEATHLFLNELLQNSSVNKTSNDSGNDDADADDDDKENENENENALQRDFQYDNMADFIACHEKLAFLSDICPQRVTYAEAMANIRKLRTTQPPAKEEEEKQPQQNTNANAAETKVNTVLSGVETIVAATANSDSEMDDNPTINSNINTDAANNNDSNQENTSNSNNSNAKESDHQDSDVAETAELSDSNMEVED